MIEVRSVSLFIEKHGYTIGFTAKILYLFINLTGLTKPFLSEQPPQAVKHPIKYSTQFLVVDGYCIGKLKAPDPAPVWGYFA